MIVFTIKKTGWIAKLPKSKFNACARQAFREIGMYWHRALRPKHFTHRGATEYGYEPRQGERGSAGGRGFRRTYTGRKLHRYGHTRPLVYTGESERESKTARIVATSKRVRVRMKLPRLNWRHESRTKTMREELTMISAAEEKRLLALFTDRLMKGLKGIKTTVRRTMRRAA
jgi:hypothetical protein